MQTLPATGYTSSGGLSWKIIPDYVYDTSSSASHIILSDRVQARADSFVGGTGVVLGCATSFFAPVDGNYVLSAISISSYCEPGGTVSVYCNPYNLRYENSILCFSGDVVLPAASSRRSAYIEVGFFSPDSSTRVMGIWEGYLILTCTPSNSSFADTYNITTRPTSISGGNYGIVGDNGQITKVEDNSTIVNETNNTFYNPATGTTVPITNWSYDYSDRSYKVTLESGDTATITYGDENITIQEGDTVYNIYYLIDGTGETPADPPAACEHDWQQTSDIDPTCTLPGKVTLTCTKCQQTKTETLPALGHDWQVKQTVTTQYDDTGQLIQQGYTIFECSRCHEQYKSTDGTIPPGGGSGTDPGGEEGETIWDKLGNLAGSVLGGLIGLIEAVLGKILDALTALAEMLMEKLKTVVETVLLIFDELPKLFGGFLAFLAAVFPYLPPELMTILTFGILAVVFIGIIKAVRR